MKRFARRVGNGCRSRGFGSAGSSDLGSSMCTRFCRVRGHRYRSKHLLQH